MWDDNICCHISGLDNTILLCAYVQLYCNLVAGVALEVQAFFNKESGEWPSRLRRCN